MNINDYKFEVGDTVITTDGRTGNITDICKCAECAARGFYEPIWNRDDGEGSVYITQICAEIGFPGYYQIGAYRFNDFVKDEVLCEMASYEAELTRLKKQLKVIEETETKESGIIEKLSRILTELDARYSSFNSVIHEYQGVGWGELCDIGIDLFNQLKV